MWGCVVDAELETTGTSSEIIGGDPTPDGEFVGVGALLYDGTFGCTGTLIAPTVVLTAAHCVAAGAPSAFTLEHDATRSDVPSTSVASTVVHEGFTIPEDPSGLHTLNDIALVILAAPITTVSPLSLPAANEGDGLALGATLDIVGFGATDGGTLGIMFDARAGVRELGESELRVSSGGAEPHNCNGDSGGPSLQEAAGGSRVVGVVSRTYAWNDPRCTTGSTHTRVSAYLPWITARLPQEDGVGSGDRGGGCTTSTPSTVPMVMLLLTPALLRRRRRPAATPGSSPRGAHLLVRHIAEQDSSIR